MAKIAKLNTNFDNEDENDVFKIVALIINMLTLNGGSFAGLPVTMIVLGGYYDTWNKARGAIYYAGKAAAISAARTNIQTTLTTNGTWLNNFCRGNVVLLKETGYPLAKDDTAQGKLDATVLTLTVMNIAGSLAYLISHVDAKAIKYGIMFTTADNPEPDPSKWTAFHYCGGQRDGVIPNLLSNVEYKFSSFAMGTDLDLTYSVPVIMKAL